MQLQQIIDGYKRKEGAIYKKIELISLKKGCHPEKKLIQLNFILIKIQR